MFGWLKKGNAGTKSKAKSNKGGKKEAKPAPKPEAQETVGEGEVVIEELPEAKPARTTLEVLGGTQQELVSRLKLAFRGQRDLQAAAFFLLALSQHKGEWRARLAAGWNKLILGHLKKVQEPLTKGLEIIKKMEEDGFIRKVKIGDKIGYAPTWVLLKKLLPVEEDMGFELALDDDGAVVDAEGEVVVIDEEEEATPGLQPLA
jgi:hypothetical protein